MNKTTATRTAPASTPPPATAWDTVRAWFARQGWSPFAFQQEAWRAYLAGDHGLIHAPTGTGKSYAAWLGPVMEWLDEQPASNAANSPAPPLRVLWITPLRALANDTVLALEKPIIELGLPWTVELRTGDTAASVKQRQRQRLPTALVTTPESLSVMLSYPEARRLFAHLRCVVVDEWHELMGTKRGVQTELGLARLRHWQPALRTWGLSATLGNLDEALATLVGSGELAPSDMEARAARLISADLHKPVVVETLIPADIERFPWAGHLGLKLLHEVVRAVLAARTTLIFTNTRAQTEIWFQALLDAHPDFAGEIALHHGSLEPKLRQEIEQRLADGRLRCVVCTSSLDLGVDFAPVDQVIQVGSPKGVGRLLQRAGRSGHQPGAVSRILCVPTHAFELVEFAAVRDAIEARNLEARPPLHKPLDVLVQHMVTVALGGGFTSDALLQEVRTAHAYCNLSQQEWRWAIEFITSGGSALQAYSQFRRVAVRDGIYRVKTPQIAQLHRMSIGTITSDAMLKVQFTGGSTLGSVEESFIARLRPQDRFFFAGRALELVRVKDLTAYVRLAPDTKGVVPRWNGGRMPLSSQLAQAVRRKLAEARAGDHHSPELRAVQPILAIQAKWSAIPGPGELLVEEVKSRDGYHLFVFPLAGRLVHEGLSTLLAYRLTQRAPRSVSAFATDYGFELLSPDPFALDVTAWRDLLTPDRLVEEILACLNTTELARRQFRDIARIAGLIFSGYPGSHKSLRQIQTSSGLLFDVFADHDPSNLLLDQARREVLEQQLDIQQLASTLADLAAQTLVWMRPKRLTPFAFPIWADRFRTQVTSETWADRVQRMVVQLERAAED